MDRQALLLDMNSTFMFEEDRFGPDIDYAEHYQAIGGTLPACQVNNIIQDAYDYLDACYPTEAWRHCFPTVEKAILATHDEWLPPLEMERLIDTFAYHELGHIPKSYAQALHRLARYFTLALVADIWSPKKAWLDAFAEAGIAALFQAVSFSSEHGVVKPSPKPFRLILKQLDIDPSTALVIGDSARRDLGGARAAGIDCILVGDERDPNAVGTFPNLIRLCEALCP
ncbi:MAG: HAD family hydrolase [Candidatus Thiodiazotropha sp. (ex Dulcina madagascariensis)]|nr:HAD family hydrolase [Candidatus Thiodiazotropha sp. (ex Dulcina madagascariensis)]